jgi:hypothetical protein
MPDGSAQLLNDDRQQLHGQNVVLVCAQDAVRYAYFAPYTFEQHQSLIAECQSKPRVNLIMLGQTLDGHDMDLLRIGITPPARTPQRHAPCFFSLGAQPAGHAAADHMLSGALEQQSMQALATDD